MAKKRQDGRYNLAYNKPLCRYDILSHDTIECKSILGFVQDGIISDLDITPVLACARGDRISWGGAFWFWKDETDFFDMNFLGSFYSKDDFESYCRKYHWGYSNQFAVIGSDKYEKKIQKYYSENTPEYCIPHYFCTHLSILKYNPSRKIWCEYPIK